MKKLITSISALMLLVGCSNNAPASSSTTTTPTPEPTSTPEVISDTPIATFTAGTSSDVVEASSDEDIVFVESDKTARTYFFDFKLNSASLYETYVDIVGDDDHYVLVANVTVENVYDESIQMYDTDFSILCLDDDGQADENYIYYPVTVEDATPVGNMFDAEYTLEGNSAVTGDLVYIVPRSFDYFSLAYVEEFAPAEGEEEGTTGATFFIDFIVE